GVLETATSKILAKLKALRMARQKVYLDDQGKKQKKKKKEDRKFSTVPDRAGTTFTDGGSRTIVIYDSAFTDRGAQFLGGTEGVLPKEAETFVHELGHVVGGAATKKQFNEFVKKKGIKPFTHYAAQKLEDEFFPEAF